MQRYGFIHGMMDVKILVLFVLARVDYPLTMLETYELCYQDDCVSYFDVCTAMDEMVRSGHLACSDGQTYTITEKGRRDGGVTEDSIAYTVKAKAQAAVSTRESPCLAPRPIKERTFLQSATPLELPNVILHW